MTNEKWLDLLDNLKQKFDLKLENREEITQDDLGHEIVNKIQAATFESDLGRFKLERVTRPVILDKKVHYSHTSGTRGLVEYVLSPDEVTSKVHLYKNDDGHWEELNMNEGGLNF